jgi:hypothetical protein
MSIFKKDRRLVLIVERAAGDASVQMLQILQ